MKKIFSVSAVIISACLHQALAVDPPTGFTALFDGTTLNGWYGYNPHEVVGLFGMALDTKLAEMRADFMNHWSVGNGELINDGSGPYACTDLDLGDMELQLEFTVGWGGDSGIYLRGNPEVQLLDRFAEYDPAEPEYRPHFGSGGLIHNPPQTFGRDSMLAFDAVPHAWQQMRIVQIGARIWVYLNGRGVVEGVEMENYWNPGQPLPTTGPILLQANGKPVRFRNIFVRSLSSSEGAEFVSENQPLPAPDFCDVQYGPDAIQVLHLWKASSTEPTPLVVYYHDGGWWGGGRFQRRDLEQLQACLDAGISYAAVSYRFSFEANRDGFDPPIAGFNGDMARALQYLRYNASAFEIDKNRIALYGGSAGACSALWLGLHDEMANPNSSDPVERESTRVTCVGVGSAQTSLDPVQVLEWIPNGGVDPAVYGVTAEGDLTAAEVLLRDRDSLLPEINEYSPYAQVSSDDPSVYLYYVYVPEMGVDQSDTAHSANFGQGLYDCCLQLGVDCEFRYSGAVVEHPTFLDFAIEKLNPTLGFSIVKKVTVDAYVRGGEYADINYGTETVLACKTVSDPTSKYNRQAYLRFKGLDSLDVKKAVLRLKVASDGGPGDTHTAYFVSDDSWTYAGMTWNNRPALGAIMDSALQVATGSWIEFDVTDQVTTECNGDGKLSVAIISDGNNYTTYHSDEAAAAEDRPELVITTDPPWTHIQYDDFESGLGNWTIGSDASLYTGGTYASDGSNALDLQDNNNNSVASTGNLALSGYSKVQVDFDYVCVSMDDSSEDFWLQISMDGGATYTTVEEWNLNDEFVNDLFYYESVTIFGYTLTDQTRLRFRCDASGDADDVYIDKINVFAQ
ncbi:CBM96 family carbohydrate-binding protein [Pontiella sulfatireligans]|uniref:Uncharacterized protein n=1 Tax=Pontiella sulfatireligans TaxID=2750658 RepID=A0A6C2UH60_9BACT|nr:family 16 glycoside hydrolase [Pontiella sulfatireligans]VGO18847.1 hypothetical protein SCARR_00900 [Pontiella sulfatireligans]